MNLGTKTQKKLATLQKQRKAHQKATSKKVATLQKDKKALEKEIGAKAEEEKAIEKILANLRKENISWPRIYDAAYSS